MLARPRHRARQWYCDRCGSFDGASHFLLHHPGHDALRDHHAVQLGGDGRAQRGEVTWAKRAPGNEGWRFAIAYSVVCAGLIASHFLQKAGLTDPVIEDKHAAALEKTISKASDASNSGKDFSFGSDDVPPEVKDMSTGHAISA